MIPVTVTYFNQIASRGRGLMIRNAVLFAGGIVVTFTALGLELALLVGTDSVAEIARILVFGNKLPRRAAVRQGNDARLACSIPSAGLILRAGHRRKRTVPCKN